MKLRSLPANPNFSVPARKARSAAVIPRAKSIAMPSADSAIASANAEVGLSTQTPWFAASDVVDFGRETGLHIEDRFEPRGPLDPLARHVGLAEQQDCLRQIPIDHFRRHGSIFRNHETTQPLETAPRLKVFFDLPPDERDEFTPLPPVRP